MVFDLDCIDLMGKRKDGGAELYIVPTGAMDDSPETQESLLDKIERYLGYIKSGEFLEEFGNIDTGKIRIILKLSEEPLPMIKMLCQKIAPWVEDNGARFQIVMAR